MKKQVKRTTYAGNICQNVIYAKRERELRLRHYKQPRPRFRNEQEREEHRRKISLHRFVLALNAAFSSRGYFGTLTFDSQRFPEVDFATAKKERDNFIRRIKRAYPEAVLALVIGAGDKEGRLHIHIIIEGVDPVKIGDIWSRGFVYLKALYEYSEHNCTSCGADYTAVARYMFDQAIAEIGQHRYYISRNADKPEVQEPEVCTEIYTLSHCPEEPGYILVRSYADVYGNLFFWYARIEPSTSLIYNIQAFTQLE